MSRQTADHRVQSIAESFADYENVLAARVRAVVDASDDVVDRACWMACAQLLHHELAGVDAGHSWLTTLAIREAVKLSREAPGRTRCAGKAGSGGSHMGELLLARAALVVQDAGLTAKQLQAVALSMWGLSDERIAAVTGDSQRAAERSIARGHEKLAQVLDADYAGRL
jgi:DNA-directed RNA polymerase specialized sigma24 family protein